MLTYEIKTTWDGKPIDNKVTLMLTGTEDGDIQLNIVAPFFNDPAPSGPSGLPFMGLWDYEGKLYDEPRRKEGSIIFAFAF